MKKKNTILFIILAAACFLLIILILRGSEDSWIKDSRGIWVKHGNPFKTPEYIEAQQELISKADLLYSSKKEEGMEFLSQCLGTVDGYAVDIVHVPRSSDDNLVENQCAEFKNGKVSNFIELDKNGDIVRIV